MVFQQNRERKIDNSITKRALLYLLPVAFMKISSRINIQWQNLVLISFLKHKRLEFFFSQQLGSVKV